MSNIFIKNAKVIATMDDNQTEIVNASRDAYQKLLKDNGLKSITTEIKENFSFYYAEEYHQQYLARPGSRPYCSAMPTKGPLNNFSGSEFKLNVDYYVRN